MAQFIEYYDEISGKKSNDLNNWIKVEVSIKKYKFFSGKGHRLEHQETTTKHFETEENYQKWYDKAIKKIDKPTGQEIV